MLERQMQKRGRKKESEGRNRGKTTTTISSRRAKAKGRTATQEDPSPTRPPNRKATSLLERPMVLKIPEDLRIEREGTLPTNVGGPAERGGVAGSDGFLRGRGGQGDVLLLDVDVVSLRDVLRLVDGGLREKEKGRPEVSITVEGTGGQNEKGGNETRRNSRLPSGKQLFPRLREHRVPSGCEAPSRRPSSPRPREGVVVEEEGGC